jgi:FkbM family methyltransferase
LRLLPSDPVILDIGACDGTDSIEFRMLFPRATIHCFEPEPSNFQKLLAKTEGLRITCHPLALGAAPGRARFFVSSGLSCASSSSLREPTGHIKAHPGIRFDRIIDVQVARLSDWIQAHGVERVDFLWMDTQGTELDILRNTGAALKGVRVIHTEVSLIEFYKGAPLYHEVRDFLLGKGFVVLEDMLGKENMGDVVFIRNDDLQVRRGGCARRMAGERRRQTDLPELPRAKVRYG